MNEYKSMLVGPTSPFALSEAFKEIRTNMLYTARGIRCPIYAVTSDFAHAGKTVISANLAASFAGLGKRVLLIDADLRNPAQHKVFGVERSPGLSEVAAGLCTDYEAVIVPTGVEGLDLVPAGHIPPNPTELLSSSAFETFIHTMQEKYDVLFLDFPPSCVVVDALIPASMITGYAFVVRTGLSDRRAVSDALSALSGVGAKVLGVILNGVDPKEGGYGNNSRSKYKYRYKYNYAYHSPKTEEKQD